jgi:hypothetical protein
MLVREIPLRAQVEFTQFGCFRNNPAAKFQVQHKDPR